VAPYLGDIHGQHEQQQLFSTEAQLDLLDQFADLEDAAERAGALFLEWKRLQDELSELEKSEQEKLRLADLWSFQKKEIEAAGLKPAEDSELENQRLVLKNVAKLQESANAGYSALYDAPESASSQIRVGIKKLEDLCRIDASLLGTLDTLRSAEIAVGEASRAVRDYLDGLEADPDLLEHVESRLALIDRLKRKYGATLGEVLAFLENVRSEISAVENAGDRKAKLEQELARLSDAYREAAGLLTAQRRAAAQKLAKKVEGELGSLALESAVFRIEIQPANWSERGADRVEFLISANVGEEPRTLDKVASGGELSRIALALKTSAGAGNRKIATHRTLVFDEIDSGIGGSVAEAVGRRLKKLSGASQVLCVTHLAQVAGFADHHYFVEKHEVKGRTIAEIEELTGDARTREIGRMLSGQRVTAEALKHAEHLIRLGAESRRQ
jgi:DNA repair protein RecN (Recombination protein N)